MKLVEKYRNIFYRLLKETNNTSIVKELFKDSNDDYILRYISSCSPFFIVENILCYFYDDWMKNENFKRKNNDKILYLNKLWIEEIAREIIKDIIMILPSLYDDIENIYNKECYIHNTFDKLTHIFKRKRIENKHIYDLFSHTDDSILFLGIKERIFLDKFYNYEF